MSVPVLSLLIIVPLAGGLSLLAVSRRNELAIRLGALAVCLLELCLSFVALCRFDKSGSSSFDVEFMKPLRPESGPQSGRPW